MYFEVKKEALGTLISPQMIPQLHLIGVEHGHDLHDGLSEHQVLAVDGEVERAVEDDEQVVEDDGAAQPGGELDDFSAGFLNRERGE